MGLFSSKKKEESAESKQEGEQKILAQTVQRLYKQAYDAKATEHERWSRNMDAYTGELFKKKLPDYKAQEISNFMFSTVETIKPIMLANNPKILALPNQQQFYDKSEDVQHLLDYEWMREKMFNKLMTGITSGLIFGNLISATIWDANDENGLGNTKYINIPVWNFFPDPMATNVDDCEYGIYAIYKSVGEVIKAFPEKAEELKKSVTMPQDEYLAYGKDIANARNQILCLECYMRDWSTEVSSEEKEDGTIEETTKLKYPNGRHILVAGDVVLIDEGNPYEDGKFPYDMWKCYELPGKFWAYGVLDQIVSPQEYISNITNDVIENIGLNSNPVWILDKNSGVEKGSLTNRKGLVVRKNPGTEIRRDAPPPIPAYIQNVIDMLKRDMEIISGVHDVTRGERPTGITAGIAIQSLNEQAQGRIKLKVQNLEQYLGSVGAKFLRRAQQFWVTSRTVRITGGQYSVTSSSNDVIGQPIGEQKFDFKELNKDQIDGDFDIIVVGGSTMPVNKTARLQQLVQMAQTMAEDGKPMIDRKTLLENADIPNVSEIVQYFEQLKQQEMAIAEQQRQQQLNDEMALKKQEALQGGQTGLESVVEGQDSAEQPDQEKQAMMQVFRMLLQMNPKEVTELAKENPKIMEALEMLKQMPEEQINMIMSQQPMK
jgi:hypothetical protein